MWTRSLKRGALLASIAAVLLAAAPAQADKPAWAGGGKGNKHGSGTDNRERHGGESRDHGDRGPDYPGEPHRAERGYFDNRHRTFVHDYYAEQFRTGHCPPGLAKKHNRCLPPGQAKKWTMGRPLPHDVVYYDLPYPLAMQIGLPPEGHRYVRVANDILLITIGTGMVVDAIRDLGGM